MRKKPSQERSRQTIEKLIEATGRAIAESGLDAVNTNRIAELAGVNIGSLYQYFHDKSELIEALMDQITRAVMQQVNQQIALVDLRSLDLRAALKLMLTIGFAFLRSNPLYLELMRNWSRLPTYRVIDQLEKYLLGMTQQHFLQHFGSHPVENLQARFFVAINGSLFSIVRYMSEPHPQLKEADLIDALVETIALSLEGKNKPLPRKRERGRV